MRHEDFGIGSMSEKVRDAVIVAEAVSGALALRDITRRRRRANQRLVHYQSEMAR